MPWPDMGIPGAEMRALIAAQAPELVSLLQAGNMKIAIHCVGGKGRTGTIAASFLTKTGVPATEAIATVRRIRPGTVETEAQEQWVVASHELFGPPIAAPDVVEGGEQHGEGQLHA